MIFLKLCSLYCRKRDIQHTILIFLKLQFILLSQEGYLSYNSLSYLKYEIKYEIKNQGVFMLLLTSFYMKIKCVIDEQYRYHSNKKKDVEATTQLKNLVASGDFTLMLVYYCGNTAWPIGYALYICFLHTRGMYNCCIVSHANVSCLC